MDPTHDPAIAELLSFFDFAHLRERTPHLAAASEPFHRLAHIMAPNPSAAVDGLRTARSGRRLCGTGPSARPCR